MKKKSVIIIILAIIVSLGIGGTVGYFLHKEPKVEEKCKKEDKPKETEPEKKPQAPEKEPVKDPEDEDGEEYVGRVALKVKDDENCGIGCYFTSEIYGARFFVNYRDTGTDGPLEAEIYDNVTGEKITSEEGFTTAFIYKDKKIYTCSKEITAAIDIDEENPLDVKPSKQMKNYNDIDRCESVYQGKKDKDVIIAAGFKDNKITFYNAKTKKYYYADRKIDKNMNIGLTILEPYHYDGEYDARLGVGYGEGGQCLEYFYSAQDNSIKEFKTDCWGNLLK